MTDAPKPPKRRRRKIIVAFVVLVFVSMVSWWYLNLPDARFVGLWAQPVWVGKGGPVTIRLAWDGGGAAISPDGTSNPLEWSFDNNVFAINPRPVPKWQQVLNRFRKRSDYYAQAYAKSWTKFTVQQIDKNQIVLLMEGANPDFPSVFTRIPE